MFVLNSKEIGEGTSPMEYLYINKLILNHNHTYVSVYITLIINFSLMDNIAA